MEYLGAWGTMINEKNLKSKISCQTPFKISMDFLLNLKGGCRQIYPRLLLNFSTLAAKLSEAGWRRIRKNSQCRVVLHLFKENEGWERTI